jgi:DNA-damage-inducible protein J
MTVQKTYKIDKDLSERFAEVCEDMGLSVTNAITLFAKAVVKNRNLPFLMEAGINEEAHKKIQEERLRRSIESLNKGEFITLDIDELDDFG